MLKIKQRKIQSITGKELKEVARIIRKSNSAITIAPLISVAIEASNDKARDVYIDVRLNGCNYVLISEIEIKIKDRIW